MHTAQENLGFEEDDGMSMNARQQEINGPPVTPVTPVDPTDVKRQKFLMNKDICFVALAFFFLFTSYQSMANLQSSINANLGTASLSVIYATMILSSAFVPTWLIKTLGVRRTIAVCMLCYSAYIAAQFYPQPYTLIPTAAILGLGASPLWIAKCTYLTHVGNKYSELSGETPEVVITRFFGIFFFFFQSTQVVGNLISSTVLAVDAESVSVNDSRLDACGAQFCQGDSHGNSSLSNQVSKTELFTMSGIYLAFALISSVVVVTFVRPLSKYGGAPRVGSATGRTTVQQLVSTFRQMRNPYQILIAPLTVWSGVEQAFISADYTVAYVSCGLGVHMVGYTMICFGVCDAVCSFFCSHVVKRVGRIPIFCAAAVIDAVLIGVLLWWRPSPDETAVFFVIPALWGVADAVWQTQINAFYGVLFPRETEAAFSNYRLWESSGFIVAYICSTLICIHAKIYILIGFLSVGVVGYITIEILERTKKEP